MRIWYLPDPRNFKLFAGIVLLYIGARLAWDTFKGKGGAALVKKGQNSSSQEQMSVTGTKFSLNCVEYTFADEIYTFSPAWVFVMTFVVGIVGGVYGIGGGAIIAPFFVAIFKMSVYTVAGAALMGTFITSVAGVAFYQALGMYYSTQMAIAPDWFSGALFGVGGLCGMYLGARCQKYVPARLIKAILSVCILFVASQYVVGFFL